MGKVFFSVPVNSVRRARCSCPGRCYLSCRVPPTAALQAPSGLGCARVPGKAAGGALGSGPSGTGGFLSGPTFQAPGSWKDSVGAPPAPDVSLQPHYTQPGCCAVPGSRLQKLPLLRASQHPGTVPCVGTAYWESSQTFPREGTGSRSTGATGACARVVPQALSCWGLGRVFTQSRGEVALLLRSPEKGKGTAEHSPDPSLRKPSLGCSYPWLRSH